MEQEIPLQPVENPILCSPYEEPDDYWDYDRQTGEAKHGGTRRPAGYWFKDKRTSKEQLRLFLDEQFDELPLVNRLREDVRRWRESGYRGASNVTRELFAHWVDEKRSRRLFFCQREAVETIIYLAELRIPGKASRTGFKKFALSDGDLSRLSSGERPSFAKTEGFQQTLIDRPLDRSLLPLVRMACKMATGSGKTVVMAMLISWAFCNRGVNPLSREFPSAVLVSCPNLTVKERLQVLRPENPENYYAEFDIVPSRYRSLLQTGKVLVTNWHAFAPESEHKEGDRNYVVVDKGPETRRDFASRVLGKLYEQMPIMVLNDEGHHCWRPAPEEETDDTAKLTREEKQELEDERQEARRWLEGLDKINNALPIGKPGILHCIDLSATPFFIQGSGYPEGSPFPWIVSDFGLVDAIESGIVKIPRLPVSDTTGRPDPKYFRLWETIRGDLEPAEFLPGKAKKPKPEAVFREAEGALKQLVEQWKERFDYQQAARPDQERIPPVLIVVCDNTDLAEFFFEKISGQREETIVTAADIAEVELDEEESETTKSRKSRSKAKSKTVYGPSAVSDLLANTAERQHTIRIDSKLLAEAESDDPAKRKSDLAEELRRIVATVGKPGLPGEFVRCVVSVAMLTEGWDANNVTHILGVRAFGSQLLCEQVVGRGLRRIDYSPYVDDRGRLMLHPEHADVYGIPFSVIPFKGRPTGRAEPSDKPKQHVRSIPERSHMRIRFPVVEGFAFALNRNGIRCDVGGVDELKIEANREPTATFLKPTIGYYEGPVTARVDHLQYVEQDREGYYRSTHLQAIKFQIAQLTLDRLLGWQRDDSTAEKRVLKFRARHQLFPQVYRYVDGYVSRKVDFQAEHPCELGLQKYVGRVVERLADGIEPDDSQGEPPLMPVLNRYQPIGTTDDVDFKTTRSCRGTVKSHINQVVVDTEKWESTAAFQLEASKAVRFYARNDHLGFFIPYEYQGLEHSYEPDFLVRMHGNEVLTMVLEVKGYEDEQTRAKHSAARRWVRAVNNWGEEGRWMFHVCRNPQLLDAELTAVPMT